MRVVGYFVCHTFCCIIEKVLKVYIPFMSIFTSFFIFFFIKAAANVLLVQLYGNIWPVFKITYLQAASRQRDVSVIYSWIIQFQPGLFANKFSLNLLHVSAEAILVFIFVLNCLSLITMLKYN